MTGIIRRGGRPNKVAKPAAVSQPRRTVNGGGGGGTGGGEGVLAAARRQQAIEQAISEREEEEEERQGQQPEQQHDLQYDATGLLDEAGHPGSAGALKFGYERGESEGPAGPEEDGRDEGADEGAEAAFVPADGAILGIHGPGGGHEADMDLTAAAAAAAAAVEAAQSEADGREATTVPDTMPDTSTTEQMALGSGYGRLPIESALAKRLAREPARRPAQQRRPEQQLNLARRSNVEALFAHIAGAAAAVPCKNCHKGHGPWTACVVVDGQMCGSCANCWFNASGARCSFHETKTPAHAASPTPIDPHLTHSFSIDSPLGLSSLNPLGSLTPLGLAAAAHARRSAWQPPVTAPAATASTSTNSTATTATTATAAAAAAAAVAAAVQQLDRDGGGDGTRGNSGGSSAAAVNSVFSGLGLSLASAILGRDAAGYHADAGAAADSALVGLVVDQALAQVRAADQRSRDLMMVEIAAKQLALAIVRYSEGEGERQKEM